VKLYEVVEKMFPGLAFVASIKVKKTVENLTLEGLEVALKELYGEEGAKVVMSIIRRRLTHQR